MRKLAIFSCILAAAACCLMAAPPEDLPSPKDSPAGNAELLGEHRAAPRMTGPQSCMATACHGKATFTSNGTTLFKGAEYSYWRDFDPHARAGETLHNDRSQGMIAALQLDTSGKVAAKCGACHSPESPSLATFSPGQGVTCESCHGPAEFWRSGHYRRSEPQRGMTNTKSLEVRAPLCAGCHVGDEDRQVDHEMIAAGHPALQFELASHHSRLPKHWDEPRDRKRHAGFETELWARGQLAQFRESLRQLDSSQPLDLARLDCYACHHDLAPNSWRQGAANSRRGRLAWNSWNHVLADAALANDVEQIVANLERLISSGEDGAADAARSLHLSLRDAEVRAAPPAVLAALQHRLGSDSVDWSWDAAAQSYLAVVAVFQDLRVRLPRQIDVIDDLNVVRGQLGFPQGFDSPRDVGRQSSLEEIRIRLQRVVAQLLGALDDSTADARP